ncbi:MAG: lysophospholipid acyltransferase family protein [Pseudomonadota bacterium]
MRSLLFNVFFYGFTFVIAFISYGLAKLSRKERMWPVLRFWGRAVLWALRLFLGGRVEIRGREHLETDGPRLLVSKHQSELDIVMLGLLFPDTGAVAMQELERYPFFGAVLRALDLVLISVDQGPQGRTQQAIDGARRIIGQGRPMIIYPEGELMALGAKERYRKGAGHIYCALGIPAIPVASSHGVIWPKREWTKHANKTAAIEFLEPIQPGLDLDSFMATVEERIETNTMRLIREHASGPALEAAEDRHLRGASNET